MIRGFVIWSKVSRWWCIVGSRVHSLFFRSTWIVQLSNPRLLGCTIGAHPTKPSGGRSWEKVMRTGQQSKRFLAGWLIQSPWPSASPPVVQLACKKSSPMQIPKSAAYLDQIVQGCKPVDVSNWSLQKLWWMCTISMVLDLNLTSFSEGKNHHKNYYYFSNWQK